MKVLIVVDMQNDFIDGALGTKEAVAIVPNVIETIKGFEGTILYTKDTHFDDYMDTQEGKKSAGANLHQRNRRLESGRGYRDGEMPTGQSVREDDLRLQRVGRLFTETGY